MRSTVASVQVAPEPVRATEAPPRTRRARVSSWLTSGAPRQQLEEYLAICSILAALVVELSLIRFGLDPQDEGYFLEQASRVLRGDLPYRDFDSLYTPGLLYLHAALLGLVGGPQVLALRATGLLARALLAFALYALCRRHTRPLFAAVPGLYVLLALDQVPMTWEPHPGWPSAALTVLAVLAFARLPAVSDPHRTWWLVGVGAITAVVFAFKQNAGAFLGLAMVAYVVWQGVRGRPMAIVPAARAVQGLVLVAVIGAVLWLIHPYATPAIAAYLLVPIVAAGIAALGGVSVSRHGRGPLALLRPLGWLALGFWGLTLPWLASLIAALDGRIDLLSGFVGAVDQATLWHPLEGPTGGAWASLVGGVVGVVLALRVRQRPLLCAGVLALIAVFGWSGVLLTGQAGESVGQAAWRWVGRSADGVQSALPIVSMLTGAWWCLRSPASSARWQLGWLTVASALTFLTEYPRMDLVHLAWSACLPLATGAVVVGKLHASLAERWRLGAVGRAILAVAVLAVPAATVLPNLSARTRALVETASELQAQPLVAIGGLPAVDGMVVTQEEANTLVAATRYLRASTAPGEPIFVYPSSPLVYVMADRPNPTRFAHLYPGAASQEQLEQIIAVLKDVPVRFVLVDDTALAFWGPPAQNQVLEDYLATNYHQVAAFGDQRVLMRS